MGSIKSETISGVKWTAIEKFSTQIVNFLLGLLIARLLSPSDFGTIGMLGIFMAISGTFIDSGFSTESFKYLFSFGSKLLAAGLLHTLYSNLSTLAIGKFYTSNDLGYYSREV